MGKKNEAIKLRKKGSSYNQISEKLTVPKSTLSYWLRDIEISEKAQALIKNRKFEKSTLKLIERNKQQTVIAKKRADKIIEESKSEFKKLSSDKLFIAGVSLYWAEGYKKGAYGSKWKVIDFVNSDEAMIALMMSFFLKYLDIELKDFKAQVIVHRNVNIDRVVEYWSKTTKIPKSNFIKTFSSMNVSSKGIRKRDSLPNGTLHVRIYSVKLFFRIIGWIEGLKKELK